jgi:hypothetical protein
MTCKSSAPSVGDADDFQDPLSGSRKYEENTLKIFAMHCASVVVTRSGLISTVGPSPRKDQP